MGVARLCAHGLCPCCGLVLVLSFDSFGLYVVLLDNLVLTGALGGKYVELWVALLISLGNRENRAVIFVRVLVQYAPLFLAL